MNTLMKIFALICLLPFYSVAQESKPYTLEGTAPAALKKIFLLYYDYNTNEQQLDSTIVKNGKFSFKGNLAGAAYAGLYFTNNFKDQTQEIKPQLWFYLNTGRTVVDGATGDKAKIIDGDALTQVYLKNIEKLTQARAVFKSTAYLNSLADIDSLEKKVGQLKESLNQKYGSKESIFQKNKIDFIKENPNNPLSLVYLEQIIESEESKSDNREFFELLGEDLRNSARGKRISSTFKAKELTIGAEAFDFSQVDQNGNTHKLSDFRGKYVLLDFWASWCVPCRAENPNLVKAYAQYKEKNFEILAVSLDNKKESWLKAIADDKLTWMQLSDLQGWRNAVSELYGVKGIPANFLIDPKGKIVAINLRGEELDKKLAEILK